MNSFDVHSFLNDSFGGGFDFSEFPVPPSTISGFSHKSLATQGLYPGLTTTRSIANLGHFEVEVTITPVIPVQTGGGGWAPVPIGQKPDRYRVTVKVKHNGKLYIDSIIVDDTEARVRAKLNGIEIFSEDRVMISVNGVQVINPTVDVNTKIN